MQRLIHTSRLVTVTGPGGVGKTRLALEVAAERATDYEYGAAFVELASVADRNLIPEAIAIALNIPRDPSTSLESLIASFLRERELLLVLDNCEHLIEASAELASRLLRACPRLSILATSREPLSVPGEALWQLAPLAVPPARKQSIEEVRGYDAIALFLQRATSANPAFTVTAANVDAVASICTRLAGIPLAIELAAARLTATSPHEVEAGLEQGSSALGGRVRGVPERHRTLRAAFEWSYALLEPEEQRLFRRLGCFVGGHDRDSAHALAVTEDGHPKDVNARLDSLANKSLITAESDGRQITRYGMLVPLRELAVELMNEHGELETARRRHCDYFASLAEQADPGLYSPDQLEWIRRIEDDIDNFRAAIEWAFDHDAQRAIAMAGALTDFWARTYRIREGRALIDRALAMDAPNDEARVRAIIGAAFLASENASEAAVVAAEGLRAARILGDRHRLATALHIVAALAFQVGNLEVAEATYAELLDVAERPEDEGIYALALAGLGRVAWSRGEHQQGLERLDDAISITRAARDIDVFRFLLRFAAERRVMEGDLERAREHWLEALGVTDLVRERSSGIGGGIHALAMLDALQGRPRRAMRLAAFAERRITDYPFPGPFPYDEFTRFLVATLDQARATLGPEAAEFERSLGWGLTPEQAIALAVGPWEEPTQKAAALKHPALEPLSSRESEVAMLVAEGLTGRQIAARLHLSERTIENHVQHALNKLNLSSRAQLAAWTARRVDT